LHHTPNHHHFRYAITLHHQYYVSQIAAATTTWSRSLWWASSPSSFFSLEKARVGEIGEGGIGGVGGVANIHTNIGQKVATVQRTFTCQQFDTGFTHGRTTIERNTSIQTTQGAGTDGTASRQNVGEAERFCGKDEEIGKECVSI